MHSDKAFSWTKICSALHFDGEWSSPFNRDLTVKKTFTSISGKKSKVPMMNATIDISNFSDKNKTIAGVRYGNGAYKIYFILPDASIGLNETIASLDYEAWSKYRKYDGDHATDFSLPRFDFGCWLCTSEVLANMGFNLIEKEEIQLPYMLIDNPTLESVTTLGQSCHIKLEETGTTTVAADVVDSGLFVSTIPAKQFVIDRPFMFLIEEQSTGAILFMGKVVKL